MTGMDEKLKEIFQGVRAQEALKERTREFLVQKTHGYTKCQKIKYSHLVWAAICALFLLTGGSWLYFMPTAEISIEINPSISLAVNRFDRVIAVEGLNDDGKKLASSLDIRFSDYMDAISRIIESRDIAGLLSENEILTISVIGPEGKQCSRICGSIASNAAGHKNMYCYFADSDEAKEARKMGLPYGKYKAFLELVELGATISPDEVREMTMRQLRDLIEQLSGETTDLKTRTGGGCGRGGHTGNCWKVQENNNGNTGQEQT